MSNNREDYLSNPLESSCSSYLELTLADLTIRLVLDGGWSWDQTRNCFPDCFQDCSAAYLVAWSRDQTTDKSVRALDRLV